MDPALAEIQLIRSEVERAADAFISAACKGLELVKAAREGDASALEALEITLIAILEACAFQDLTGQRLSRLESFNLSVAAPDDDLLRGPARQGEVGISQACADGMFEADSKPESIKSS